MGERKVLNRYFPPDFDPLLVPRRKWDPYKQVEVRMMIPFSLQCVKCARVHVPRRAPAPDDATSTERSARRSPEKTSGKKFNSRKEDVVGDTYLGIRKYRFYIKCCVCSNEIAFKTDPQNQDYACESARHAHFESWRQQDDKEKEFEDEQKESNEQRGAARHS
ncbi:mRNA splicing protein [Aureococcus anophagefferens]|uniref:mRNA splicing protein n=1 Tax=Aureococcus anophagefferens TaxID=44056 RepID=A0ABR1FV57_AURAN